MSFGTDTIHADHLHLGQHNSDTRGMGQVIFGFDGVADMKTASDSIIRKVNVEFDRNDDEQAKMDRLMLFITFLNLVL